MNHPLKQKLTRLYTGSCKAARRFRFALIAFDALTIILFIVTAALPQSFASEAVVLLCGGIIMLDFGARLWISTDRAQLLRQIYTIADMIVIA